MSFIMSALLKESFTRNDDQLPTNSLAISLILVKALINTNAAGGFFLATSIAYISVKFTIPVPIDLPMMMIFYGA